MSLRLIDLLVTRVFATPQILATCGFHHLYQSNKAAGLFLRPSAESPRNTYCTGSPSSLITCSLDFNVAEDCLQDFLFRSFERNVAGQMWLESLFDFDSLPCFGRFVLVGATDI